MVSGEAFVIYTAGTLPAGWLECDGSVISDGNSSFNGNTLPNLNNANQEEDYSYFLRGAETSGNTEVSTNKSHTHTTGIRTSSGGAGGVNPVGTVAANDTFIVAASGGAEARPMAYTVVWIMRVK